MGRQSRAVVAFVAVAMVPAAPAVARAPRPDLVVSALGRPPASAGPSALVRISVRVANRGQASAKGSRAALYLSSARRARAGGFRASTVRFGSLRAGRSSLRTAAFRLPSSITSNTAPKPGSYYVVACADYRRQVRETSERNNCRLATRKLVVVASPSLAFQLDDGYDYGERQNAAGTTPTAGQPVTTTLRIANGLPGTAGYTRTTISPQPLPPGASNTLSYGTSHDDASVIQPLPFAVSFAGVPYTEANVSTNGWVAFGAAAVDYFDDNQFNDFRGLPFIVGHFDRGAMPFWSDLDLEATGSALGTVNRIVAPDNSYVAFAWDTNYHNGTATTPRRQFDVVFFRDGRIRYDYPGVNSDPGLNAALIGLSNGNAIDIFHSDAPPAPIASVPAQSILYTPNSVSAGPAPAGRATTTLPRGSALVSADPGCSLAVAPSLTTDGRVDCTVGGLPAGGSAVRHVTWSVPAPSAGLVKAPNLEFGGAYAAGGGPLVDTDELNLLSTNMRSTTIDFSLSSYDTPATPKVGVPSTFTVRIKTVSSGLHDPRLTIALPANTIGASTDDPACGAPSAGHFACPLPSGGGSGTTTRYVIKVMVTPTAAGAGNPLTLAYAARADNAPLATGSTSSPNVTP
ncbi:MAG: hypothetical protein QOK31_601 [Solirubrobacteraceae bacterium]|nr:hypothetical protein [Solirubrobacteraceae bacterium]